VLDATPQVLCEFKDIRSRLDAKQNRKGSNRSPVQQCLNYVRGARRELVGNEPVQPWWGLVTDMNEFRLYWWDRAPAEYLRFVIKRPGDLFAGSHDLLTENEDARFDRFLFRTLLDRDMLIAQAGEPRLLRTVRRQWQRERGLEGEFYAHYRDVRENLFNALHTSNPSFGGSPGELLRLTQKLLDRFIFLFYCEDMGEQMLFPPQLVREYLQARSIEPFYDPADRNIWEFFKRLFAHLDTGGAMGLMRVPHINGGLFAPDPAIEALSLPNHVFAAPGQGGKGEAAIELDRTTLLFLCGRYNYAARGDVRESLSLYTLGRIFEQSITELEYRTGELEGRKTVAALSKRKRDGVYYTPEWVVNLLVEQTLGPWFSAQKAQAGYPSEGDPDAAACAAYLARLRAIRIVDPACGSGAFLISAFRRLLDERIATAREVASANAGDSGAAIDEAALISDILSANLYGVDLNPSSVEITKLALWLHSARAKSPLSSLDHTIRCGNSLVGPDFWSGRPIDEAWRERVADFDWRAAFPEIWPKDAGGGFDIVLGNPPYVKLQNLMKVDPAVVAYIQAPRGADTYASAQTGNFDLYLPFVEKGLRLLAPGGRIAFIAPSLWAVNEYGEGLRRLIARTRQLERWIDFKSHQIFEEAITYTALQFFTKEPQDALKIAIAPHGEAADVDWAAPELAVPYATLPASGEWLMANGPVRALIDRLVRTCQRLDDPALTSGITVGIQTSADHIYHLDRLGPGRYRLQPKPAAGEKKKPPSVEIAIEDAIMRPLVSGAEAKRYEEPSTETYLLFPYERDPKGTMRLIPAAAMQRRFPKAWAHLGTFEQELRDRERKKVDGKDLKPFDDDNWHRFGRNQNIDKQDQAKLVVAQTVPELRVCADTTGDKYLNNVRVNGILAAPGVELGFLLAVLNEPVADFVFRQIGKPKQGGWFEANRQFIAPLPIPRAKPAERAAIGVAAVSLQARWTRRRELLVAAGERLAVIGRWRGPDWLWPDLPGLDDLIEASPAALRVAGDRRAWAEERLEQARADRLAALQAVLDAGRPLAAEFQDGELRLTSGGAPVLRGIYLDSEAEGRLAAAYWRFLFLRQHWSEAAGLAAQLLRRPLEHDKPAARQFVERVHALARETSAIASEEQAMNERLYTLYGLTDAERLLVENEAARKQRR
jgi:SAM-dependent methyltransferase